MSMQQCKSCGVTKVMLKTPQSKVPYCPECGTLQEPSNHGNQAWEA